MNLSLNSSWRWVTRYLSVPTLIAIGLIVYILFFGENTVYESVALRNRIDSLENVLSCERDTMLHYVDLNGRLASDRELMEQVVREQYNMKRPSEDVYLIEYDD
ncbi:MAG: hypothetical protein K2M55_03445 [Muribaculaceae bacterium]|nr:hypothetical protein [Muribaculaceae bacterium]